ncbi:hypothetical protein EV1_003131 [Malus domestica]
MQPLHSTELRTRRGKLRNQRGIYFSKRVSICHMHTQLCKNHGQFVEMPIPDIEEASAFPNVSAPVTCTLSFAKITSSLSKRRFQISKRHLLFQTCQHLSHATSALDGAQKSKRQAQKSERHLLFQTCQHLSHAHLACGNYGQSVEDF